MASESKSKDDALKQKKKLEAVLVEIETELNESKKAASDSLSVNLKLQLKLNDLQTQLENEQNKSKESKEAAATLENRVNQLVADLNQTCQALHVSEKTRKELISELAQANDNLIEANALNVSHAANKRKFESRIAELQVELNEVNKEFQTSEEKLKQNSNEFYSLNNKYKQQQVIKVLCFF